MSRNEEDEIVIHQSLHGYSDGHRLLAASTKLSKESLRTMLVLSDMSGPSMTKGFEEYLTAYALPGDGFLALAKTWHAPEMKRAGCVWTHTLLVPASSLRLIATATGLLPLLRKPSAADSAVNFDEGIRFVRERNTPARISPWQAAVAPSLLAALYGSASPIVMVANTSREFEDLFLAIWAQLWPLDLPDYRFCTGSIRFRDLEGTPFDLQVIPPGALREAQRRFPDCTLVESPGSAPPAALPDWASAAVRDLVSDPQTDLRQFLWDLASCPDQDRTAFRRYLSVFTFLKDSGLSEARLAQLVSLVAESFPTPSQASRLKEGLFGGPSQRRRLQDQEDFVLLKALATSDSHSAYAPDFLSISRRTSALWRANSGRVLHELLPSFHPPLTPLQEASTAAIIDTAEHDQLCPLVGRFQDVFLPLVAERPQILAVPSLWQCPPDLQATLVDLVASSDRSPEWGQGMLLAQLAAANDAVADKMAAWLGEEAVRTVLNWVDSTPADEPRSISPRWQQLLAEQPTAIIQWLTDHPRSPLPSLLSVVYLLDPNCRAVRDSTIDVWVALADRASNELEGSAAAEPMAFFLVVALRSRDQSSSLLVARSFPAVYEAASTNALSQRAFMTLQSEFSGIAWNWDRCRRLRRTLVESFAERSWPTADFLQCTRNTALLSSIYGMWGWGHSEVRFLRQVIRDATGGNAQATDAQLGVLTRYAKWFR